MKKLYIFIPLFALLFTACDKEANIIDSFDFTIEETHNDISTINLKEATNLEIIPENTVSTDTYSLKYKVIKGSGNYYLDDTEIDQEQLFELSDLNTDLSFISSSVGVTVVKLEVINQAGLTKELELTYNVEHNPYTFKVTSPNTNTNVNLERPFSVSVFNNGDDLNVTYERAFFITQGTGAVLDSDNRDVKLGSFLPIEQGVNPYNVRFAESGASQLRVVTRDSNGQEKEETIVFNVDVVAFSFTAVPAQNQTFIQQKLNINFTTIEDSGSGGQYSLSYSIEQGNVTILNNGRQIAAGTPVNVNLGVFSWQMSANTQETVVLKFVMSNESGAQIERNVQVDVISGSFQFDPVLTANKANVNEEVIVNAQITQVGPAAPPYKLSFTSSGTGVIIYQGNTYAAGQPIPNINGLNFAYSYKGLSAGNHKIVFSLTDANENTQKAERNIEFDDATFTFTGTSEGTNVNINDFVNLNFNITQIGGAQSYQMRYTIDGGSVKIDENGSNRNAGVLYSVNSGDFSWRLQPLTDQNIELTFYVINDSGVENETKIELAVTDTNFSFGLSTDSTIQSDMTSTIKLDLDGNPNNQYQITYNIAPNNGSTLQLGGNVLNQNTLISVGTSNIGFDFTQIGSYDIQITIRNNYSNTVTQTVNIEVRDQPFTMDLQTPNIVLADGVTPISLNINGSTTNIYSVVSYEVSSANATLDNITVGQELNATNTFNLNVTQVENFDVTIVVRDNFNKTETVTKTITPEFPSFITSVDVAQVTDYLGTSTIYTGKLTNSTDFTISEIQFFDTNSNILNVPSSSVSNGTSNIFRITCRQNTGCNVPKFIKVKIGSVWSDFIAM